MSAPRATLLSLRSGSLLMVASQRLQSLRKRASRLFAHSIARLHSATRVRLLIFQRTVGSANSNSTHGMVYWDPRDRVVMPTIGQSIGIAWASILLLLAESRAVPPVISITALCLSLPAILCFPTSPTSESTGGY